MDSTGAHHKFTRMSEAKRKGKTEPRITRMKRRSKKVEEEKVKLNRITRM
jgi:hypothetical protein